MAVTGYWDDAFVVHSLVPRFKDANGETSPLTIEVGESVQIATTETSKSLVLMADPNVHTAVAVYTSVETEPDVWEEGKLLVDLTARDLELPLEKIKFIKIENLGNLSMQVSFTLLEM